jgi:hypothetical protein
MVLRAITVVSVYCLAALAGWWAGGPLCVRHFGVPPELPLIIWPAVAAVAFLVRAHVPASAWLVASVFCFAQIVSLFVDAAAHSFSMDRATNTSRVYAEFANVSAFMLVVVNGLYMTFALLSTVVAKLLRSVLPPTEP